MIKYEKKLIYLICIFFTFSLLSCIQVISVFKILSNVFSIMSLLLILLIFRDNKMKLNSTFLIYIMLIVNILLILINGCNIKALFNASQFIFLISFSFILSSKKIDKIVISIFQKYFSYLYYIILILVFFICIIGKKQFLQLNISMSVFKAIFAISIFPFTRTKRKGIFTFLSSIIFFIMGERTSAIIFLIIFFIYNYIKKIKSKQKFNLIFLFIMVLLLSFIVIYTKLPYTNIGIRLNEFSRNLSGENFFSGRNKLWETIFLLVKNNKFFGLGFNNNIILFYGEALSTHNLYMWLLLNGGYTLLISFILYMYMLWKNLYNNINDDYIRATASYIVGILILVDFELLLVTNNFVVSAVMWFVIVLGCGYSNSVKSESKGENDIQ